MSQINDRKINHVVGLLKSWQTGYISPSAQMAIKDGIELIEALQEEVESLYVELAKYKNTKTVEADDIEF